MPDTFTIVCSWIISALVIGFLVGKVIELSKRCDEWEAAADGSQDHLWRWQNFALLRQGFDPIHKLDDSGASEYVAGANDLSDYIDAPPKNAGATMLPPHAAAQRDFERDQEQRRLTLAKLQAEQQQAPTLTPTVAPVLDGAKERLRAK